MQTVSSMSQIINLHSSTRMLGSAANKAQSYPTRNFICAHCHRRQTVSLITSRGASSYISALKLMLKKKQNQKDDINYLTKLDQKKKKRINESGHLLKSTRSTSKDTEMNFKASDVTAFAEDLGITFQKLNGKGCFYESTRSYDPNILFPILDVDQFLKISENENQELPTLSDKSDKLNNQLSNNSYSPIESLDKNYSHFTPKKEFPKLNKTDVFPANSDVLKILPLSAVEIFPLPKSVQYNVSGKYAMNSNSSTLPKNETLYKNLTQLPKESSEQTEIIKSNSKSLMASNFHLNLIESEIDVCLNSNMEDKALTLFNAYRNKAKKNGFTRILKITKIYNMLLFNYSEKGNWMIVQKILSWMNTDGVKCNAETYAATLYCLSKNNFFGKEDIWRMEVLKILKAIHNEEISLDKIFTVTNLTKDQNEGILQTIRKILPYFEIAPTKVILNSDCDLTKDLFKENISFRSPLSDHMIDTLESLVEEQLIVEKKFSIKIKSVYKANDGISKDRQLFDKLNQEWREMLRKGFIQSLKVLQFQNLQLSKKINLYVYLNCLPVDTYADIMMQTVQTLLQYSGGYSPDSYILQRNLGDRVYHSYQLLKKIRTDVVETTEKLFKKYCSWYIDPYGPAKNTRQQWEMVIHDYGHDTQLDPKEVIWPEDVKNAIGKYLFNIILQEVNISISNNGKDRVIPVFYPVLRHNKKNLHVTEEIKCHPIVNRIFQRVGYQYLNFDADQMPMVCPPKPWKSITHGGYLILGTRYVRKPKEFFGEFSYLKNTSSRQLYPVFDSLNALQAVPWTINNEVLDIVLKVFREGGSEELNIPVLPESGPIPLNITEDSTYEERKAEYQRRLNIVRNRNNQYGLWCESLYRLSLADHFRGRIFWLPQNIDFRGRVYPVPPHLNHLGSDLFRSLLLFAVGKPLGPKGLDWLKIHIINLTGTHKKRSVTERLDYANKLIPEILNSAEKPLTGNKWWTKSEDPWQTLAGCMELKKALESVNPENYVCRFPVHQDGSCNGLQHYAALGRDKIGANSVNLAPNDTPQDIYTTVMEKIEKERFTDAEKGLEIAKVLEGFIKRKVVKQTIMTTVYGVTYYGGRLQIARQLEDIPNFPKQYIWKAAGYLTEKTFSSLREMFESAKQIQDWFIGCSKQICSKGNSVEWITPLGMPVRQPYFKGFQRNSLILPNKLKQKNAFPPNFIHSLDSTHMMLTSLFCEQAGITFSSIHDCFWTHACSVDQMNKICREQFISLHSRLILENLSNFFIQRFVTDENSEEAFKTFSTVPERGTFDIGNVMNSVYFFS